MNYSLSISGEHPNSDEYRQAMIRQGKVLLRLTIERWGPISPGRLSSSTCSRRMSEWARCGRAGSGRHRYRPDRE